MPELKPEWPAFESLPKPGEPGTGLANSPRLSAMETAVVLSPEHYEEARADRETAKRLLARIEKATCRIREMRSIRVLNSYHLNNLLEILEAAP